MTGFLKRNQRTLLIGLLALLAIGAGWYIAVCTKFAPWGFSDSSAYLSAARNFAAGRGLGLYYPDGSFSPLNIFAPFYSILLSLFAALKADLVASIRILDMLFFAILVAASGWLFYKITQSFWLALCLALLITFTPALAVSFSSIMSDPLALSLGFPGFLLLTYALRVNSTRLLILSAALCGLSLLTRYAFAAFPAAGIVCVLLFSGKTMRKRMADAVLFGVLSFAPMLVWMLIQWTSKLSLGARHYSWDFSILEKTTQFTSGVFNVLKYWLPYRTGMIPGLGADQFRPFLLGIFAAVVLFGLFLSLKKTDVPDRRAAQILNIAVALLIVCYLGVLFVIYSISTETISIDERMLSPLAPMIYALLLCCSLTISRRIHPKFSFPILGFIIALFFVVYNFQPFRAYPILVGNYPNGYTSPIWMQNPILTRQVGLPPDRPLITNAPDILLFYTNRSAYTLTARADASGAYISTTDQTRLQALIHGQCAELVLFDPPTVQRFQQLTDAPSPADVAALQAQWDVRFKSANGLILADNECSQ